MFLLDLSDVQVRHPVAVLRFNPIPDSIIGCALLESICVNIFKAELHTDLFTLDISLGCSGWVHGMAVVASLMQNGSIKKALLLAGDAKARVVDNDPLFGDAGTARLCDSV